jgi:hypothetical protein
MPRLKTPFTLYKKNNDPFFPWELYVPLKCRHLVNIGGLYIRFSLHSEAWSFIHDLLTYDKKRKQKWI